MDRIDWTGCYCGRDERSCADSGNVGQLFTSSYAATQQANYVFEPPSLAGTKLYEYGYAVAFVPGYPFVLISEHYQDVGSMSEAGQVHVYQMN